MATGTFFRGGPSLTPRLREVRIDTVTGLVQTTHGVSVYSRPDGLNRFGGVFEVGFLPTELRIIQRGRDPFHYEIVPAIPMIFEEYEAALSLVSLTAV